MTAATLDPPAAAVQADGPAFDDEPIAKPAAQASSDQGLPPLVTAMLVFSGPAGRVKLAQRRVDMLLDQTYPNLELVIINASGTPITNKPHDRIREIDIPAGDYSIAALRNKALKESRGEFVTAWDDDDVSHPHRIALQMATLAGEGEASALTHQVRIDVSALNEPDYESTTGNIPSTLVLRERPQGEPSTLIWKRVGPDGQTRLFDETLHVNELSRFMEEHFPVGPTRVVYNNARNKPNGFPPFPAPVLHVAFYHGVNASSRDDFLAEYAGDEYINQYVPRLDDQSSEYLAAVGDTVGLKIQKASTAR